MKKEYTEIIVQSFIPENTSGLHGKIHIRPVSNQSPFEEDMMVECSKDLSYKFEVGTRFIIRAIITSRKNGKPFIYSSYKWPYTVLK